MPPAPLLDELPPAPLLEEEEDELACMHVPPLHTPPEQGDPSGFAGWEQSPVCRSQIPASWHSSSGVHETGFPPLQEPAWQISALVQALPSSQGEPFGFAALEQVPVCGLQTPDSWHGSGGGHTTGLSPTHAPA